MLKFFATIALTGVLALTGSTAIAAPSAPQATKLSATQSQLHEFKAIPIVKATKKEKALIKKLFKNYSKAFNNSTKKGLAFIKKNNYPNAFDTKSESWKTSEKNLTERGFYDRLVPRMNTLVPDPDWLLPQTNCSAAGQSPLQGNIYLITVESTSGYTSTGQTPFSQSFPIHVAVLNNKAYLFFPVC